MSHLLSVLRRPFVGAVSKPRRRKAPRRLVMEHLERRTLLAVTPGLGAISSSDSELVRVGKVASPHPLVVAHVSGSAEGHARSAHRQSTAATWSALAAAASRHADDLLFVNDINEQETGNTISPAFLNQVRRLLDRRHLPRQQGAAAHPQCGKGQDKRDSAITRQSAQSATLRRWSRVLELRAYNRYGDIRGVIIKIASSQEFYQASGGGTDAGYQCRFDQRFHRRDHLQPGGDGQLERSA